MRRGPLGQVNHAIVCIFHQSNVSPCSMEVTHRKVCMQDYWYMSFYFAIHGSNINYLQQCVRNTTIHPLPFLPACFQGTVQRGKPMGESFNHLHGVQIRMPSFADVECSSLTAYKLHNRKEIIQELGV